MTSGITVVGLGPGEPGLLTREAWVVLEGAEAAFLRTSEHPVVPSLPHKLMLHSFDDLYRKGRSYEGVYSEIIDRVCGLKMYNNATTGHDGRRANLVRVRIIGERDRQCADRVSERQIL